MVQSMPPAALWGKMALGGKGNGLFFIGSQAPDVLGGRKRGKRFGEVDPQGGPVAPPNPHRVTEVRMVPRAPSRLANTPYLQASHFQLGFDRRPEGATVISPYRIDYPPRWGSFRSQAIRPPKCAGVLNQDMDCSPWDTRSETYLSYPPRRLEERVPAHPPSPHLKMHRDPRQGTFTSVTRDSYPYPPALPREAPRRGDKWDDSVPSGDKEKQPLPASLYQQSYPSHGRTEPAVKAPSQHLGGKSPLRGGGCPDFGTTYQTYYTGKWGPPAEKHFDENLVSVVFGDPRCHQMLTEQKRAYTPKESDCQRYDPERAAAQVRQTNIQPGDGRQDFTTVMSEAYPWRDPGPLHIISERKNESSILRGDRDPERNRQNANTTIHRYYYREPNREGPASQAVPKPRKDLTLGDNRYSYFCTTQHDDYREPPETRKLDVNKWKIMRSNIPFNYPAPVGLTTSTQDMLVPHQQAKYQVSEEELQKIKYSHLVHPWKDCRWFSTEQKDAYTNKYEGPVSLVLGDNQRSSLPLGTLPNYSLRKTITHANVCLTE
ncbi:stabilizer of axonemal microtubules 5 [Zootoca vivipara]|uniref:stabilizer of axonemal microtubules 5 n=1 Tax=Zootoca vivipara TaxID=8524 RepID=UPI00293BD5F0|nr:stabilizer of axonemal microtubules 5 [Zootoca vivipara]